MKLSVVIPMYNESRIIEDTAKRLAEYMPSVLGENEYEIVFSDDGSTDNSVDLVKGLKLKHVRVLENGINRGKGSAVRAAMLEAQGDVIMFTDADLAYGTEVIGSFYERLNSESEMNGASVIIGSRNLGGNGYDGYGTLRKLVSKLYIQVLCVLGDFNLSDSQCGCKAFSSKAAKDIFGRCLTDGFAFDFEAIIWAKELGYGICEMPVRIVTHNDSKVRLVRDSITMFGDLFRIRKRIRKACKNARNTN